MSLKNNCIAVTLCINYSDYLVYTLSTNTEIFKKVIVITEESDNETISINQYENCELFITDRKNRNKSVFNKSAMIRHAQHYVHKKYPNDWICLIDADTEIPQSVASLIDLSTLDKKAIYGLKRFIYMTLDSYKDILNKGQLETEKHKHVIGCMQLYFNKNMLYQRNSYNCSSCEIDFAKQFKKEVYFKLPNYYCKHLGEIFVNWNGRKSIKFS